MSMFREHKYDARDMDNKEIHITQGFKRTLE